MTRQDTTYHDQTIRTLVPQIVPVLLLDAIPPIQPPNPGNLPDALRPRLGRQEPPRQDGVDLGREVRQELPQQMLDRAVEIPRQDGFPLHVAVAKVTKELEQAGRGDLGQHGARLDGFDGGVCSGSFCWRWERVDVL